MIQLQSATLSFSVQIYKVNCSMTYNLKRQFFFYSDSHLLYSWSPLCLVIAGHHNQGHKVFISRAVPRRPLEFPRFMLLQIQTFQRYLFKKPKKKSKKEKKRAFLSFLLFGRSKILYTSVVQCH